jgi:hypothetical protein
LLSQLLSNSREAGESSELAIKSPGSTETVPTSTDRIQDVSEAPQIQDPVYHDRSTDTMAPSVQLVMDDGFSHGSIATSMSNIGFDMAGLHNINTSFMDHRDLLGSRRGRGTSLERTQKEKRIQGMLKAPFSTNPGDTGMMHILVPQSPAAVDTISNTPPTDGVRAQYRSWRDTHGVAAEKAWSIGEQGPGDVAEGQVEKSITEALAGIEPNSRSRKASHSLRFFREGLPEDKQKKREIKDGGRSKDKSPRVRGSASSGTGSSGHHDGKRGEGSLDNNGVKILDRGESDDKPFDTNVGEVSFSQSLASNPDWIESDANQADNARSSLDDRPNAMPEKLLEDLRRRYNLSSGTGELASFRSDYPSPKLETPSGLKVSTGVTCQEPSPVKSRSEDEDSGEEHISSALFVPHLPSHGSPDGDISEARRYHDIESTDRRSSSSEPEQWLVQHQIPGEADKTDGKETALEGQPSALSDRNHERGVSDYFSECLNSTESLYDTPSDAGYTTKGEESSFTDDPEVTPTGKSRPEHFMSKHRKSHLHHHQLAKAPLEAIELIPYRHQVGGHTTMWRFSKRAVCKKLNNRENEFYETVEKYHPKLLKFMPRYVYLG